jgi:hypothetical protein
MKDLPAAGTKSVGHCFVPTAGRTSRDCRPVYHQPKEKARWRTARAETVYWQVE